MHLQSQHGSSTVSRFTPVLPVSTISARRLELDPVCFSTEIAEQIALITEESRTQIALNPISNLFYLIVHDSASTGWVASIDDIQYTTPISAREAIEQAATWRSVFI